MALLIFAFQSHTPTSHRVIGKEVSITCQLLSSNTSNNLEVKALGIHGTCRLILKVAPQLPAVVRLHRPSIIKTLATWRKARGLWAITGLFGVYRHNSSSRVTRCRVREEGTGFDWSTKLMLRVWWEVIGSRAWALALSPILVHLVFPHMDRLFCAISNLQAKDHDLSIFKNCHLWSSRTSKVGWLDESHSR